MTVKSDGNITIANAEEFIKTNIEQPSYEMLCKREYLERAADLALLSGKGKITPDKQAFISKRHELMDKLEDMVRNETYKFSDLYQFKVYEPKERVIDVPNFFPDRILERAVTDLVKPLIIDSLIANTFGSILGRGLHQCVALIATTLQARKDIKYFVKIDAHHYYESINHERLKNIIRTLVADAGIIKMLDAIIDVHSRGLAIGVYPSQYLANFYLSIVDWAITEGYGSEYYYRYMDDIVILVRDKQEANKVMNILKELFTISKLTIKNNARIAPISYGINFCGYVVYSECTLLRRSIKIKAQRKARALDKAGVPDLVWAQQMASYYGWFKHANCAHLWLSLVKNRKIHYKSKEKMKKLSQIKNEEHLEFGLPRDYRENVTDLKGLTLEFHGIAKSDFYTNAKSNESKLTKYVVKFRRVGDGDNDFRYFISGGILAERIMQYQSEMPFEATIEERGSGRRRYLVIV